MANVIVTLVLGGGRRVPVQGKATKRFYGYKRAGDLLTIDKRDLDAHKAAYKLQREAPATAATADATPSAARQAPETMPEDLEDFDDLTELAGVGEATALNLNEAGVFTFAQLVEFGVDRLSKLKGLSEAKALDIVEAAREKLAETDQSEPEE